MFIIDCHVHPTPCETYAAEGEHFLRHMRMHHIAMMIASDLGDGWGQFPDSATVRYANDRLRDLASIHAPELQYLVYLNPQLPDWAEEFERHTSTAVGVKLWISLKASDGTLDRAVAVLRRAAQRDWPVLIHTYHRTDPNLPGEVNLDDLILLARTVPECQILAAHAGGNWRAAIARRERIPDNVRFDVSGGYPERGMVRQLVDAFGAERLLYGSDAPGRSFGSQLSKVAEAGLTAAEQQLIYCDNAVRLFHLEDAAAKLAEMPGKTPERSGSWPLPDACEDHFCFAGRGRYWDQTATAAELAAELKRHGVTAAYAAGLATIFSADRVAANRAWRESCAAFPAIQPLAAVDLRDEPTVRRQLENMAGFAGIWVSPYLHDYDLNAPMFQWFWNACAARGIGIWINAALSDDRFRSPKLATRAITEGELSMFMERAPRNRYVVQGMSDLAAWTKKASDGWRFEDSKLSDGEYAAEQFFGPDGGSMAMLVRGSEYPFRTYRAVDDVLYGRI